MKRKKEKTIVEPEIVKVGNTGKLADSYLKELDNDVEYSLEVDPENKYNLTRDQKLYVIFMIQYRDPMKVGLMLGISTDDTVFYSTHYGIQQEIRRINKALYQRRFAHRLLELKDIEGYLASMITDENVPIADRLEPRDKLKAVQLLLEVNKMKSAIIQNPAEITNINIETQIKNLSVDAIKSLLNEMGKQSPDKDDIIDKLNSDNKLSPEEITYLKSLDIDTLLGLLNDLGKGE